MTPDEMRAAYVGAMGAEFGEVFHALRQDFFLLYLKWNEFVALYGKDEAHVAQLNRAAPGFFWLVQETWWDDILLHVARLTDERSDVLSLARLRRFVRVGLRDEVETRWTAAVAATEFARDRRNRQIAHRNLDLALSRAATPLAPASRADVRGGLSAMAALLDYVDSVYTGAGDVAYEFLTAFGGVESLFPILERGSSRVRALSE